MALLKLVFLEGLREIPSFEPPFKPRALVGFKLRTEPELYTGDSHFTSTPPRTSKESLNVSAWIAWAMWLDYVLVTLRGSVRECT